jgi:hypothetical protein
VQAHRAGGDAWPSCVAQLASLVGEQLGGCSEEDVATFTATLNEQLMECVGQLRKRQAEGRRSRARAPSRQSSLQSWLHEKSRAVGRKPALRARLYAVIIAAARAERERTEHGKGS